ncbi:MAG: tetratricopeptide repeat protein, partial [Bacteroidota bacterium]|nr:tetratricopeptide repeat protein [Bacteroidota bacterium]
YDALLDRYGASREADRALFGRARAAEAMKRSREAADDYAQCLTRYAGSSYAEEAAARLRFLERFAPSPPEDALPAVAAALAGLQERQGTASTDVLLGKLFLEHLKDHASALRCFSDAIRKGVSGEEAGEAAFGKALATLRLAQAGTEGNVAEAERELEAFIRRQPPGRLRDEAAWELFLSRIEGKPPVEVLDAAAAFLSGGHEAHVDEVRLRYASALQQTARNQEAEKECTAILAGAASGDVRAGALYTRALARKAGASYAGALEDLRACLEGQPDGPWAARALYELAHILNRTGRHEDAARTFLLVKERFPYAAFADSAAYGALDAFLEGGFTDKAVLYSASLLQEAEKDPFTAPSIIQERLFLHATTTARAGDAESTKRHLIRYVVEYPEGPYAGEAYYALGRLFRQEGRTALAAAYLQRAGAAGSGTKARREAADLLLEEGRNEEAVREYEKLAATAPSRLEKSYALSRVVVALFRADRLDEATRKAAAFRSEYPDAASVFEEFELERGKYLYRKREYAKAMDLFDKIADSNTKELAALGRLWMGKTYDAQNLGQKAEKEFRKVLSDYRDTPAAAEASLSLARMALRAEKWDEAAKLLKAALDVPSMPQSAVKEAMSGLITCYEEMRMYDAAAEMTRRFLDLFPGDPTAFRKKVNLGEYYYQLQFFNQAITHFENLLTEAPAEDQAEIRYYIGECYYSKGDFTQAALEFLKVPYLVVRKTEIDWTASAYDMAARAYKKLGKYDLARDMYRRIIDTPDIDPRFKAQAEQEIESLRAMER